MASERELALRFGVNRATMREALGDLERSGLLSRRQGSRAVVTDFHRTGTLELLADLVGGRSPDDPARLRVEQSVHDLVTSVFVETARLAAQRRTTADLEALHAAVTRMEAAGDDRTALRRAQQAFRSRVTAATASVAFELAANTVRRSAAPSAPAASNAPAVAPASIVAFHRALLGAIEQRRPDAAGALVRGAMASVRPAARPRRPDGRRLRSPAAATSPQGQP